MKKKVKVLSDSEIFLVFLMHNIREFNNPIDIQNALISTIKW